MIKETTCFQSNNPSQIDLILTNQSMYKFSNTFETGLSDNHKLISTISKLCSFKETHWIKVYQSYKYFNIDHFKCILNQKLNNLSSAAYDDFEKMFLHLFNKRAPFKKILRHKNGPFMTKELRKEIMKRPKLKNKYNKKRNYENWSLYKKQKITLYHC